MGERTVELTHKLRVHICLVHRHEHIYHELSLIYILYQERLLILKMLILCEIAAFEMQ